MQRVETIPASAGWEKIQDSGFFDPVWYASRYRTGSRNAAEHYLKRGWRNGNDPSLAFSTEKYLAANPDVRERGMNPLLHYETYGRKEGRRVYPSDLADQYIFGEKARCSKAVFAPESGWNRREPQEETVSRLAAYDVVSFDIFDTLILRSLRDPADLFRVIGCETDRPEFAQQRTEAEQECYRLYGSGTTIADIYALLAQSTDLDAEEGIRTEFGYEKLFCHANPYMKDIYDRLLALDSRIILVSDMYWPEAYLAELLRGCGYDGWEALFVSCDAGYSKGTSLLQRAARKQIGYSRRVIHVGDSWTADRDASEAAGWDSLLYRSCRAHSAVFYEDTPDSIPLSVAEAVWKNTLHNGQKMYTCGYEHGFLYGGMMVLGFCAWIQRYCEENRIDRILFLARDMDIFYKVYEKHFGKIPASYAAVSRNAVLELNADRNPQSWFRHHMHPLLMSGDVLIGEAIRGAGLDFLVSHLEEAGLAEGDVLDRESYALLNRLFLQHRQAAAGRFAAAVRAAEQYFRAELQGSRRVCLAELGWSGTVPLGLKTFLESRDFGLRKIDILMLGASCGPKATDLLTTECMKAYLFSGISNRDLRINDLTEEGIASLMCMEAMFTSEEGTLLRYDTGDDGQTVFVRADPSADRSTLEEIRRGIADFADLYMAQMKGLKKSYEISGRDAFWNYSHICRDYPYLCTIFGGFREHRSGAPAAVGEKESFLTLYRILQERGLLDSCGGKTGSLCEEDPEVRIEELEDELETARYYSGMQKRTLQEMSEKLRDRTEALEQARDTIDRLQREKTGAEAVMEDYSRRVSEAAVTIDRQRRELDEAKTVIDRQSLELRQAGAVIDAKEAELRAAAAEDMEPGRHIRTEGT